MKLLNNMRFKANVLAFSLILGTSFVFPNPCFAAGELEFQQGLRLYKSKRYPTAAKRFEESLAAGNGSAEVYIYMAHSYAAMGKTGKAVERYNQIRKIFKGLPAQRLAEQSLKRIDPHGKWRAHVARQKSLKGRSGSSSSGSSSATTARKPLVDRITIIPPIKGHPAVNPHTVTIVKQTLLSLPKHVYRILDEGGTTVSIGPNIIDKWPDAIYGAKPGLERITLSEEGGRTYDRAVYLWERSIDLKTERLKPRRSPTRLRNSLIYVLGHAYNDCLGPLTTTDEFKKLYDDDSHNIHWKSRPRLGYFLQGNYKGTGDVFCAVFASTYGGEKFARVMSSFPKSTRFIKNKLATVNRGGSSPKDIIAKHKVEKPKDPEPHRIAKKSTIAAHTNSDRKKAAAAAAAAAAKKQSATGKKSGATKVASAGSAASKTFTEYIPEETRMHYRADAGDHLFLRGTIEGKPIIWLLDTGAFETIIGKQQLRDLGIKPPPGPSSSPVSSIYGTQPSWDMELNITVGEIRKTEKVKIVPKIPVNLLGQPFLTNLNYSIDRANHYITFNKKDVDTRKHVHKDSFEIPFRLIDNHMIVIVKVNGVGIEMMADTGAPFTLITGSDNLRLKLSKSSVISKFRRAGSGQDAFWVRLKEIELGPIKKSKFKVQFQPTLGGKSILGHDFFGDRKYVIDNDKKVIRYVH